MNTKLKNIPNNIKIVPFAGLLAFLFITVAWVYSPIEQADVNITSNHKIDFKPVPTNKTKHSRALNHQIYESLSQQEKVPVKLGPLPTSLLGANHGTQLRTTEDGNLYISEDVRDFFEFYLSAIEEESLETILRRINHDMTTQLSGDALKQAKELLRNYIDYKISLAELENSFSSASTDMNISALKQRNTYLHDLREEHMGAVIAEAFFSQDEFYDLYMLNRIEVLQDKTLSPEEKSEALASVEQMLPEKTREARAQSTQHLDLSSAVTALRKDGASDQEVFQLRSAMVGADAAGKLASLDVKRALWQQRLKEYVNTRDQITSSGLSYQEQTIAINDLIEERFQGRDQLRVRALNADLKSSAFN